MSETQINNSEEIKKLQNEYLELMDGYLPPLFSEPNKQWRTEDDYFVKFSLYPQTESGPATANTDIT